MRKRFTFAALPFVVLYLLLAPMAQTSAAQQPEPIVYNVKFPAAAKNLADVEAVVPTGGRETIDLMMPVWTPGYYVVQNYAAKVQNLSARTPDGMALKVEQPQKNRWQVKTGGAKSVVLSYKLLCNQSFVTTNYVADNMMVLNGGPSFITLVEKEKRPHDIVLELSPKWKQSMSGLDAPPNAKPHHYRAPDFDTLVDSPIVAGNLAINEFAVDGSKHYVVAAGDTTQWDGKQAAINLEKLVQENRRMWGFLPFKKYVFIFSLKDKGKGGGGLEHANSALMMGTASSSRGVNLSWFNFVSHEYFHAYNVKRLRPVELGPFDYENAPKTTGLWVSEGLTNYYGPLVVTRSGLGTPKDFLAAMSKQIGDLQKAPGRLVQTLDKASYDVWTSGGSGVAMNPNIISYYVKGPVVGLLLDAKIQKATMGTKSLDDMMRLAFKRYGGEKGFTPDQFRETAEEVAGIDLKEPFRKWLATTDELDYAEVLDWFGLRFAEAAGQQKEKTWRLEIRPDATDAHKGRMKAWLEPGVK